jgi:uncharacterized phiE125 gp8 family phage protein
MPWLETVVTAEPAAEPITLEQAKAQCRAEGTSADDALFDSYIKSARIHVEKYCGIRLVTQTIVMRCSSFCDFASLADGPLQSITSISYLDTDGAAQALDAAVYQPVLFGLSPNIRLKPNQSYPTIYSAEDAITVTAQAGYGAAGVVPAPIVHAIKLLVGQWYDNRSPIALGESVSEIPNSVAALLSNYRRWS